MEEEAQGQAQEGGGARQHILRKEELRGEARCGYVLVETEVIGGEGRWKDSIINRYKKMRTEEEGGGTSTKEAHEEEDEEEGTASSSGGGGTERSSGGGSSGGGIIIRGRIFRVVRAGDRQERRLQQFGSRRAPPLQARPPQPQQQRRTPRPRGSVAPHLPPPNPQPQPVGQIPSFYPNGDAPDISALGGPFNYPKPRVPEHWPKDWEEQLKPKRTPRQPRAQQQGELEADWGQEDEEEEVWGQEDEEEEVEAEEEEGVEEEGAN